MASPARHISVYIVTIWTASWLRNARFNSTFAVAPAVQRDGAGHEPDGSLPKEGGGHPRSPGDGPRALRGAGRGDEE